jgi:Xaa-Pro dipeptidase
VYFQDDSFWHEPATEPEGYWLQRFELRYAKAPRDVAREIDGLNGRVAKIGEPGGDEPFWNPEGLLTALDYCRAIKTDYERACIEEANAIAARGHAAAALAYGRDASEFTLHQAYIDATGQRESELPYQNIVALNEHAAVLHYQNLTHDVVAPPSSFLLDAGASYNGYAADVTRCHCRQARQMQDLIAAMEDLQMEICGEARVGVDFVWLNELTHRKVGEVLAKFGLVRCPAEQAYELGITSTFLPHGLGHLLGLQVHDAGGRLAGPDGGTRAPPSRHPMLRLTRTLEAGFILTIEPGIYFIPVLLDALRAGDLRKHVNWDCVQSLAPFGGVRIEDNVCITDTGPVNLTRAVLQ